MPRRDSKSTPDPAAFLEELRALFEAEWARVRGAPHPHGARVVVIEDEGQAQALFRREMDVDGGVGALLVAMSRDNWRRICVGEHAMLTRHELADPLVALYFHPFPQRDSDYTCGRILYSTLRTLRARMSTHLSQAAQLAIAGTECAVCFEPQRPRERTVLPLAFDCPHSFCPQCTLVLVRAAAACPLCRAPIMARATEASVAAMAGWCLPPAPESTEFRLLLSRSARVRAAYRAGTARDLVEALREEGASRAATEHAVRASLQMTRAP
eukprot:jgi/Tetstr1/454224/TSEL_041143.t1